ncbi:MAG: hypothetical protein ACRDPT_03155 [Streptomycetales bacterium]
MTRWADHGHLPGGHEVVTAVKTTPELWCADAIHIAGFGTFAVAAPPVELPGHEVLIRLAWERLAVVAAIDAEWEAVSVHPPIYRHRSCPACAGTGRCPDPWNWRQP